MLRNITIVLTCLLTATNAIAQKSATSKTTEIKDAKTDYQQMGAPLAPLILLIFHDTSSKKDIPAANAGGADKKTHSSKRRSGKESNNKMYLTADDVDNNANLLVMIFNPGCSHCEDETAVIQNNFSLFKKTELVMVAKPASSVSLSDFYIRRRLSEFPAIHIGTDSSSFIGNTFVYGMLPQINIYDHDRKLIKIYNGEISIDSLKKYIE
jgi:hypothetical protein